MQTSKLHDELNYKKQIKSLSHIYCAVFQDCHAILTAKTMMKKHEHRKNHNKSTTFSHTHSSHYFRSDRTIYRLFSEVYKATCKKHSAVCQISN